MTTGRRQAVPAPRPRESVDVAASRQDPFQLAGILAYRSFQRLIMQPPPVHLDKPPGCSRPQGQRDTDSAACCAGITFILQRRIHVHGLAVSTESLSPGE